MRARDQQHDVVMVLGVAAGIPAPAWQIYECRPIAIIASHPRAPRARGANVVARCLGRPKDQVRMADLKPGWTVVGNDGRRVGEIRDVGQNYILTSIGLASDIYVPASAIGNVDNEVVHLTHPQHDVAEMGWAQPPRDADAPEESPETDLHRHV